MRVEEMVGRRLREARERAGLSQAQLGTRMGAYTGKLLSRQSISQAEQGQRAFTAAELIAFAHITRAVPAEFLTPPDDVDDVVLPGGFVMPRSEFATRELSASELRPFLEALAAMGDEVEKYGGALRQMAEQVQAKLAAGRAEGGVA